jgi:hypothetical protein
MIRILWLVVLLASGVASAQVVSLPHAPPTVPPGGARITFTASDGTIIAALVDANSRIVSASGTPKGGKLTELEINYQDAALTYLLTSSGSPGSLSIAVSENVRGVEVQAQALSVKNTFLITQHPQAPDPDPTDSLEFYWGPAAVSPQFSDVTKLYSYLGNTLNSLYKAYGPALAYFAPVLDFIANTASPWRPVSGYEIATALFANQSAPYKMCSKPDAGGSAFGLLVCIGVGVESTTFNSDVGTLIVQWHLLPIAGGSHPTVGPQPCVMSGPDAKAGKPNCKSSDY